QEIKSGCWIYPRVSEGACISNLSASDIYINDILLEQNQEKQLQGGEIIILNPNENYVFCLNESTLLSENDLKRPRDVAPPPLLNEETTKVTKSQHENLQEELTCAICKGVIYNCVTLAPCQHNFCSACLSEHLQHSMRCPLCRENIILAKKNQLLRNLIDHIVNNSPQLQRTSEEYAIMDQKDLISQGYNIVGDCQGVYLGYCHNLKREGQGKMAYLNGTIYDGYWRNDKKEGKGKLILPNGDMVEGEWINNMMCKHVKWTYRNGDVYEGDMDRHRKKIKGVMIYSNGDRYEGKFENEMKHGEGKYIWKDGAIYVGSWSKDNRSGYGTMRYVNGDKFIGIWEGDRRVSWGTFILQEGMQCYGYWVNDILERYVNIRYLSGDEYRGEAETVNFKREGEGIYYFRNGDCYCGNWKDDLMEGIGKLIYRCGTEYEGSFLKGVKYGEGVMRYMNGRELISNWKDGILDGECVILQDGNKYRGVWIEDVLEPVMKVEYADGDKYEGEIETR
ncbi:MAG: hypothetical protein EOP48_22080, partial [Sphingobacteriales bacterium]